MTLLEIMIALLIFSFVLAIFCSNLIEATDVGKYGTVDTDLRVRATNVLASISKDLRSTQPGLVTVAPPGTNRSISFFPITSVTDLGPNFALNSTNYSWNANLTSAGLNWSKSKLVMTSYLKPGLGVDMCGNVTDFTITPLGTTLLTGFPDKTSQTFRLSLTLGRQVFPPTAGNPNGQITVTVTTDVTVLRAE